MATWILLMSCPRGRSVRDCGCQARALPGIDLEPPAEGFDALAHAADSVAFALDGAAPVVLHAQNRPAIVRRHLESTAGGAGVAENVGDGFAQDERQNRLLHRLQAHASLMVVEHYSRRVQRTAGTRDFREEAVGAIPSDGFPNLGERLACDLLDFADLMARSLRVAFYELARELRF